MLQSFTVIRLVKRHYNFSFLGILFIAVATYTSVHSLIKEQWRDTILLGGSGSDDGSYLGGIGCQVIAEMACLWY